MECVTLKSLLTIFVVLLPATVFSADLNGFIESLGPEIDSTFAQKYVTKTSPEEMVEYMMNQTLPGQASIYNFLNQVARAFQSDLIESQYIENIEYTLQQFINVLLKEIVGYLKPITCRLFYYQIDYYLEHEKFLSSELETVVKQLDGMFGGALLQSRPARVVSEVSQN